MTDGVTNQTQMSKPSKQEKAKEYVAGHKITKAIVRAKLPKSLGEELLHVQTQAAIEVEIGGLVELLTPLDLPITSLMRELTFLDQLVADNALQDARDMYTSKKGGCTQQQVTRLAKTIVVYGV